MPEQYPIEKEIIALFAKADKKAMDLLYDHYADALYGIVSRMLPREESAHDVMQDSFVKIWKNCKEYDPSKGRLFTWLVRIVRNQAIDALRKENRNASIQGASADVIMEITPSDDRDLTVNFDLVTVLNELPLHERALIEHAYILGYTHPEIAEKFEIPLGTVKTRIRNAMIELRRIFGNGR